MAEYWIVDGDRLRIERFTSPLPESGEYQHHEILTSEAAVTSVALPQLSVRLSDLFQKG